MDRKKAIALRASLIPEAKSLSSFPGLLVMPEECKPFSVPPVKMSKKSDYRIKQLRDCKDSVNKTTAPICLFVGFSNDWPYFLMNNKKMLTLDKKAESYWQQLEGEDRAKYNIKDKGLLNSTSRRYLESKIDDMEKELISMFEGSHLEKVYVSSILERMLPGEKFKLLPLYFAVLNSYYQKLVRKLSYNGLVRNRFGVPIQFRFINVAKQFFTSDYQPELFRRSEVKSGILTHRHLEAMKDIVSVYIDSIRKDK